MAVYDDLYDSITPLATVAATTTRAKISASDTAAGLVLVQLDPTADKRCFIGDVTVTAAGTTGVILCLAAGQDAEIPIKSTAGLYVVMFTGSAGANVYVSVFK